MERWAGCELILLHSRNGTKLKKKKKHRKHYLILEMSTNESVTLSEPPISKTNRLQICSFVQLLKEIQKKYRKIKYIFQNSIEIIEIIKNEHKLL